MYEKFLKRLKEIREYEWNQYDIKIHEEHDSQRGVREGETALEAIARHMVEVLDSESLQTLDDGITPYLEWNTQIMYEHKGFGWRIINGPTVLGHTPEEGKENARRELEQHISDYVNEEDVVEWDVRVRPA